MRKTLIVLAILALPLLAVVPQPADSACCYFAAKDKDILQPAQKAFLTFDEAEKVETFTVQTKFEGNASDFGMVNPRPPSRNSMRCRAISSRISRSSPSSNPWTLPSTSVFSKAAASRALLVAESSVRKKTP